jgi:chromosomal replication initiator protein
MIYVSAYNADCYNLLRGYEKARAPDCVLIKGQAGMGKTMLLLYLLRRLEEAGVKAGYVEAAAFARKFAYLAHCGDLGVWRRQLRDYEVLVVDGLEHLIGKERTQDELFHTMRTILLKGGKAVFAAGDGFCQTPPSALARDAAAALWSLAVPTDGEKEGFFQHCCRLKAGEQELTPPTSWESLNFRDIAQEVDRQLSGAEGRAPERKISRDAEVILATCQGVTQAELKGRSKKRPVTEARRRVCLGLEALGYSVREIADYIGSTENAVRERCKRILS